MKNERWQNHELGRPWVTDSPHRKAGPNTQVLGRQCQVGRIGKRRPKWRRLKDKGKARENRAKEGPRTGVRTSGKTNSPPGSPDLFRAGSRGRRQMYKRRSPKDWDLSSSRLLGQPTSSRVYYPLFFLMGLSCGTDSSVTSAFCDGETEPGK